MVVARKMLIAGFSVPTIVVGIMLAADDTNDVDHKYFDTKDLASEFSSSLAFTEVEHNYFETKSLSSEFNESQVSEASSCPPMCPPLPSGKQMNVPSIGPSSTFTRDSQKDASSSSITLADGVNELFLACRTGDANLVGRLLDRGDVDINRASTGEGVTLQRRQGNDWKGMTALALSCYEGHFAVTQKLLSKPEINVNMQDQDGYTPLAFACMKCHISIVKTLVSHPSIDVNHATKNGYTGLTFATRKNQTQIVEHLLTHPKINVNDKIILESTALMWATSQNYEKIVELLVKHPKININQEYASDGQTALICAASKGYEKVLQFLLSHPDIDVTKTDNIGKTAMTYARTYNYKKIMLRLESHYKNDAQTILIQAATKGNDTLVEDLLLSTSLTIDVNKEVEIRHDRCGDLNEEILHFKFCGQLES